MGKEDAVADSPVPPSVSDGDNKLSVLRGERTGVRVADLGIEPAR